MFRSDSIIAQVHRNCTLSDAHHAGRYSVCGLALRLRDLYKWENRLDPWVEEESGEILKWIEEKEEKWENLEEGEFENISFKDQRYDPFESEEINEILSREGLYYGAGYARSLKPTFFLAILEQTLEVDGHTVQILGRELARDLSTLPALSQNGQIIIRKDAGKYYFWDQLFFIKQSGKSALEFALKSHGVNVRDTKMLQKNLSRIFDAEIDTYIYHELGEVQDTVINRDQWREIIAVFAGTPIELLARTVKDLLADTSDHGLLRHVITEGKMASLAFYAAFIDGLAKELFPEIRHAFSDFTQFRNWEVISQAVQIGRNKALRYAETLSRIYKTGKSKNDLRWAEAEMKKCLLVPLGVKN